LRNPALAPTPEIRQEIEAAFAKIKDFATKIHTGVIQGSGGEFKNFLLIGIGGSALGPQFVAQALGNPRKDKLKPFFFDNTDPDGMNRTLAAIGKKLDRTLCIVISKSGGTKETRNGMLVAQAAYEKAGLNFGQHAVAVTMFGSELDKYTTANQWLDRFPMWDWVGGRTSELSAVGLLPAALQGIDIDQLLAGGQKIDSATRVNIVNSNPAALLALAWYASGNGKGLKNMVVLPYKDRLELFSKYLQQLVMESLGKERDLDGNLVNQGLCVFGNKGSTDQHSYIQQLRDGLNDFFATFIEVQKDQVGEPIYTETDATSGDFLAGFFLGTRSALAENSRESITITVKDVTPATVGLLIALFERAVGFYANLVNINAYHQPGVEAGKKAAGTVLTIQREMIQFMKANLNQAFTVLDIVKAISREEEIETAFKVIEHLAANPDRKIKKKLGKSIFESRYKMV
jgi:glucose-6-phosphate isomerase